MDCMQHAVDLSAYMLGCMDPAWLAGCRRPRNNFALCASQVLWLDQADAQAVADGEEVTLMDWGNAIIRVRACQQQHLAEP